MTVEALPTVQTEQVWGTFEAVRERLTHHPDTVRAILDVANRRHRRVEALSLRYIEAGQ